MTNLKELQTGVLSQLGGYLAEFGFNPKPKGQTYYKKASFGKLAFHLAFVNHPPEDFDIIANVAIRFDDLEKLLGNDTKSFSIGAELGNIREWRQKRWRVHNESEVSHVVETIFKDYKEIGLPYLDKYSSMENTFELLTQDGKDAWIISPLDNERAKRAVGLAILLDKKELFNDLIEKKTNFLQNHNSFGLNEFLELIKGLRKKYYGQV